MPIDKGVGLLFKNNYCQGDNSSCAGYMVAKELGKEKVPKTLYPNMVEKARKLLPGDQFIDKMAV